MYPLYQEISYCHPVDLFHLFAEEQGSIFLDSSRLMSHCGRYSFIGVYPFKTLICKNSKEDPFHLLEKQLAEFELTCHPDMPPFQGGVAGFFSYDLYQYLEKISVNQLDDIGVPDLMLGFYDVVIAFDHEMEKAWVFSSGFPEKNPIARERRAKQRLESILKKISTLPEKVFSKQKLALEITSNFTSEEYCAAVEKVKDYILAGDIFEANISQRFKTILPEGLSSFELYCRLREINAAPFSAYFTLEDVVIASASPERFLKLSGGLIETRPIKGTRPRGKTVEEDALLAAELLASEKDHAENVMIVDLLRNDLSRVCEDHTVLVPQLCGLESYASVHHLVSVVTGKMREEFSTIDLLRASFPGGSITGAPKIRAMEIIGEIEPTQRGAYCGSVGYIGFNGDMDTSITIRTYTIKNQIITFQAGGAIVVDSDPVAEYQETLTKAQALRRVLTE